MGKTPTPGIPPEPSDPVGQGERIPLQAAEEQLQRILASDLFAQADRLRRLLRFVTAETLAGRRDQLKEYNLGLAVFERGNSYDPRTDPIVRVEAGRLRSRLATYYATAGAADPLVIELPKGSYAVTVRPRAAAPRTQTAPGPARRWRIPNRSAIAVGVLAVLVSLLGAYSLYLRQRLRATPPAEVESRLWRPLLASEAETVIVFGTPMFFESEQKRVYVRPYDLNDPEDFRNRPEYHALARIMGPLSDPRYAYAQVGDAIALERLGAFFGRRGKQPQTIPSYLATWEGIKDRNIVLLGSMRQLTLLKRLPVALDFEIRGDRDVYNRRPRQGEQSVYSTPSHTDAASYAVIAFLPGLKAGRSILILTSHGSAGTNAAAEYLTQPETLRELETKLGAPAGQTRSYQVLLRVLADKDEAFKTEYITHHTADVR